jgi:hypothetical protein
MIIVLERFAYLDDCTRGVLHVGNQSFQTIERPWVKNPAGPGGVPFQSCVPDGTYRVRAYTRPSGKKAFILSNPDLGVWEQSEERPNSAWGRYLILIHPGNTVEDVVGCIAPGLTGSDRSVGNSRAAMLKLHELLEGYEHDLAIRPKGAT